MPYLACVIRKPFPALLIWLVVSGLAGTWTSAAENRLHSAINSITAGELEEHVTELADDVYEGRLAGSRGGRAAGKLIAEQLETYQLDPAGEDGTCFQPCNQGYRNILATYRGSDPDLADEVIVVSAHYDHVGYGTPQTSYGPVGYIHNGADDNASGVAALLETIEGLHNAEIETRRPILFAFWDGEELGLIGSKHWVENPTIPREHVRWLLNVDMVGWLREGRLEVGGTRSGYGMRQLMCGHVERPLWLDFRWEMDSNSDHWPFFERQIPVAYLHTGLHDHYHRPTDDVERLNHQGLQRISRYILGVLVAAANVDQLPEFRTAARSENQRMQRRHEQPAPPLPPRIGINWKSIADGDQQIDGVELTRVVAGSPADSAGLQPGDRLVAVEGVPITDHDAFQQGLLAAAGPVELTVERKGHAPRDQPETVDATGGEAPLEVTLVPVGDPVRLGISWREDEAEPGAVYLSRVVPGSPAGAAGLEPHDRIYRVDGQSFENSEEFGQLVVSRLDVGAAEVEFLIETQGVVRPVTVRFPSTRVSGDLLSRPLTR